MSTGTPIAEATGLAAPAGAPALIQEPGTLAAFWRRLRARKSAVAGLVIVGLLILMAVFAPWIAPYDPTATDWGNVLSLIHI